MTGRLILCDDEVHILRAAEIKLSRAGYEVRCASDGEEGWELIQQQAPDMLITDYQMPRLDGLGLIERIRANEATRDLPIVMLTAKGFEISHEAVARQFGVLRVLAKPFSPRELLQLVNRTLGNETSTAAEATSAMATS